MKIKISFAAIALVILSICFSACAEEPVEANIHTYEAVIHDEPFAISYLADVKGDDGTVSALSEAELAEIDKSVSEAMKSSLLIFSEHNTAGVGEINKTVDAVLDCNGKLLDLIKYTYTLSSLSGGRYDPSFGAVTDLYKTEGEITTDALTEALKHTGVNLIEIEDNNIRKKDRAAKLDFDSVSCGYSIADAVAVLESRNISYAVLTYGNTVATFGCEGEETETHIAVYLADGNEVYDGILSFSDAVATTCNGESLVIDYKTGERIDGEHNTVVVYCDDGIASNMLAPMLYSMNEEEIMNFYNSRVISFEAVVIEDNGEFFTTSENVKYEAVKNGETETKE